MFKKLSYIWLIVLIMVSCSDSNKKDENTLIIGVSPDNRPFEYYSFEGSGKSQVIGFDIDLIRKVTHGIGKKVHFLEMDFDGLIPALKTGRIDVIASALTPTPERRKSISFSDNYYQAPIAIISLIKNKYSDWDQTWNGKVIGIQMGSSYDVLLTRLIAQGKLKATLLKESNLITLIESLKIGRIDGLVCSIPPAKSFVKLNSMVMTYDKLPYTIGFAFGMPQNSKLETPINMALEKLKKKGTINNLIKKWFK